MPTSHQDSLDRASLNPRDHYPLRLKTDMLTWKSSGPGSKNDSPVPLLPGQVLSSIIIWSCGNFSPPPKSGRAPLAGCIQPWQYFMSHFHLLPPTALHSSSASLDSPNAGKLWPCPCPHTELCLKAFNAGIPRQSISLEAVWYQSLWIRVSENLNICCHLDQSLISGESRSCPCLELLLSRKWLLSFLFRNKNVFVTLFVSDTCQFPYEMLLQGLL